MMPATALTTLKKIAFTLLCCTVLMVFVAPAQTIQQIKADPGTNNPPPVGPILDLTGTPIPGGGNPTYKHYTVNFIATVANTACTEASCTTAITFAFRDDPAQISFANASVVDLTTTSGNLLTNGNFATGTISGWTYANGYGAQAGGYVTGKPGYCYSINEVTVPYCWFDGAVQAYDAISQTINTNVGHNYQISFDVAEDSAIFAYPGNPLFPEGYPGSDCYLAAQGTPDQFPCNFSDLSINGDTTDPGGNGINVTVYAQGGLPPASTQQGAPIGPGTLAQPFVLDSTSGQHLEYDFDYTVAFNDNDLTIQQGTTPFASVSGLNEANWWSIVNGTSMADTYCLQATGQGTDAEGHPLCAAYTYTCTTDANPTPSGANCPISSARNILFSQGTDLVQTQNGIVTDGTLTIPPNYAPGVAMAPDVLTPGAECSYPTGGPLATQVCPQNIMTQILDNTPHPGGTAGTANSTFVFFCCEPEWQTTPMIKLWNNSTSVPVSFTSVPPATPNPNLNNFHAAQGAFVVAGAELPSLLPPLDPTFPAPGEQNFNAYNGMLIPACPALGVPPATPWSTQNPQPFTVNGTLTTYDNGTTAASLTEGPYIAHYFSVDCDTFEELVYPPTLNVTPGTPGTTNQATFKTVPFNIDLTPPTVTYSLSASGPYPQNSTLTATLTCTDPVSGGVASGVAKCGPQSYSNPQSYPGGPNPPSVTVTGVSLPTSSLGTNTYTVVAVDAAGNSSSPLTTITYQVVGPDDLAIGMFGNLLVKSGTNMTYHIFVVNGGPNAGNLVNVTDTIPAGTTFVSSGYAIDSCTFTKGQPPNCSISPPPPGSCGSVAGICSIGTLPAWTSKNPVGAVVQITVKVNAKPYTLLTDTAKVSGVNSNTDVKFTTATWLTLVTK